VSALNRSLIRIQEPFAEPLIRVCVFSIAAVARPLIRILPGIWCPNPGTLNKDRHIKGVGSEGVGLDFHDKIIYIYVTHIDRKLDVGKPRP